ncbi:MAG: orotidine-5'-phosphate decarboxylase [Candidatus Thermoplasmatota archaeon]|jgi:orotidine-5'-phosphate decarboxylase|nr:orotidine-5'-phosphate decarboxylase [Candidatus Thermoplasmatota archaeon]
MNFLEKYEDRKTHTGSRLVVGLDPVIEKMPPGYDEIGRIADFFEKIIDATHKLVLGYKPNIAFFEQYGPQGLEQLKGVCQRIRGYEALLILDAKRGDIGHTNQAYAREIFEYYDADATTINPLLGFSSLGEFLDYEDKYLFVLNFTSNPGSEQFFLYGEKPLYKEISDEIFRYSNCGAVAGATKLEYLEEISKRVGNSIILVPGIGAQGGSVEGSIEAIGEDKLIFNASRSIIYASRDDGYHEASGTRVIEINELVKKAMERVL